MEQEEMSLGRPGSLHYSPGQTDNQEWVGGPSRQSRSKQSSNQGGERKCQWYSLGTWSLVISIFPTLVWDKYLWKARFSDEDWIIIVLKLIFSPILSVPRRQDRMLAGAIKMWSRVQNPSIHNSSCKILVRGFTSFPYSWPDLLRSHPISSFLFS